MAEIESRGFRGSRTVTIDSTGERRLQERLRLQGGPSVEDYLKARDAIEPERRVIVVVGITGAGKS